MTYRLNLGFGGLCLFVHDADNGLMHVLMPKEEMHKPTLIHDEEATGQKPPQGVARTRSLKNTLVDLTGLTTKTPLKPPPTEVADLGCRVPRKLVRDGHPGSRVAARVTFSAGFARVAKCGEGAIWDYHGEKQLPIRVVWEIDVDEADVPLIIQRGSLNSSAGGTTVDLNHHDKRLDAWFVNSPEEQLPKHLPPITKWNSGTSAGHFRQLFQMVECDEVTIPRLVRWPDYEPGCYDIVERGFDLTCIAARAPLESP